MRCPRAALVAAALFSHTTGLSVQRDVDVDEDEQLPGMPETAPQSAELNLDVGPPKALVLKTMNKMKTHSWEKETLSNGCGVLAWRIGTDNSKDWLHREGLVAVTMKALKSWPDDKTVQTLCGGALSSGALYHKGIADEAGREGAVEAIMEIMKRWPDDPSMQVGSMVGNLMGASEENRKRWIRADGIKDTIKRLHDYRDNAQVVLGMMTALSNGIKEDVDTFENHGGLDILIETLRDNKQDHALIEEVMKAGLAVATNPQRWQQLIEKNYVHHLLSAMDTERDDTFLQTPACDNLVLFAKDNNTRVQAVNEGAIGVALDVVNHFDERKSTSKATVDTLHKTYASKYTSDRECMAALAALAEDPQAKAKLEEANALDIMNMVRYKNQYDSVIAGQIEVIKTAMAAK